MAKIILTSLAFAIIAFVIRVAYAVIAGYGNDLIRLFINGSCAFGILIGGIAVGAMAKYLKF